MAEKWIKGAVKRPGALTAKAKAAGAFHHGKIDASFLKAKPGDSTRTKRQKALARTFRKMN
jgi:hypothetical protein